MEPAPIPIIPSLPSLGKVAVLPAEGCAPGVVTAAGSRGCRLCGSGSAAIAGLAMAVASSPDKGAPLE